MPKEWALDDHGEPVEVQRARDPGMVVSARFTYAERQGIIKYAIKHGLYLSQAVHDLVLKGVAADGD